MKFPHLPARLALALCVGALVPAGAPAQPAPGPDIVKVRTAPFMSYVVSFIAKAEGYFAQEGLKIEFVTMDSTEAAIPALVRGDLDVLPAAIGPGLLNTIARGARIRSVASQNQHERGGCTRLGLVASRRLADSGALRNAAALRGRRLATDTAFASTYFVETQLKTLGLTTADFEALDVPPPVTGDALKAGRLDLAVMGEPWLSRVLATGDGVIWAAFQDVIPDFQYSLVFYGPSLLDKRPDVGKRFMTAYLRGMRQLGQGKTERNIQIMAAETGLDRDLLKQACWPSVRMDGAVRADSLLAFQAWALTKKLVDRTLSFSQVQDDRFLEYANARLSAPRP